MSKAARTEKTIGAARSRMSLLAAEAQANPFRFFTSEEVGELFGFGENVMTTLRGMGAPVVGRKMNPGLLLQWLQQHHDRVPKVRSDEEE
ncbi:hypothetical protein CfE428DRAFT_6420 [Chthoniobacter flavus Ellin428]|uniref:Uncharacterized protein n=1 Tax=Chthoniobacter flavus Ellin428 TaxID=497964 RepID=B4DBX9_9BACT|nr:hypothetical protein [Chthoniobacter flavus]EDY16026.1 hypothetical protein CfE428DRAFT_6420 [Chthoniobacter flavus Ellin428]TCO87754.1 hypothetical protein EV701_12053 [Chthoniobacter flavus]